MISNRWALFKDYFFRQGYKYLLVFAAGFLTPVVMFIILFIIDLKTNIVIDFLRRQNASTNVPVEGPYSSSSAPFVATTRIDCSLANGVVETDKKGIPSEYSIEETCTYGADAAGHVNRDDSSSSFALYQFNKDGEPELVAPALETNAPDITLGWTEFRIFSRPTGTSSLIIEGVIGSHGITLPLFSFDVEAKKFVRRLRNCERNGATKLSQDQTHILDIDSANGLFVCNLLRDEKKSIVLHLKEGEEFWGSFEPYNGDAIPSIEWVDDSTVRYEVYSSSEQLPDAADGRRKVLAVRTAKIK